MQDVFMSLHFYITSRKKYINIRAQKCTPDISCNRQVYLRSFLHSLHEIENQYIINHVVHILTFMYLFRYIMFSRYWTEIIVNGILPLLALIGLNYGIYLKIRKSARFRKLNGTSGFVMRFKAKRQSMPNTEENIALQHLHVNHNWDNGR